MPSPTDALWEEYRRLDSRQHAHANDSTRMQGELDEICSRVERLEGDMKNVATKTDLQFSRDLITAKLDAMKETVDPIKRGVYAVVWLIIAAVIAAGLAFLFNKPATAHTSPPSVALPRTP
jgi:hypothetical protein